MLNISDSTLLQLIEDFNREDEQGSLQDYSFE